MSVVGNISVRQRILSFFEMKEGLIKSKNPKSYLDYVPYSFFPFAFIIPYFTEGYYFFENHSSLAISIYIFFGLVWVVISRLFLPKHDEVSDSMKRGVFLDVSVYKKQLIIYRVLSGIVFCLAVAIFINIVFDAGFSFEMDDLFLYIAFIWILIISGSLAIVDENNTVKIIKVEQDRLRVSNREGENFILLEDLKQIKIAGSHLSFFPKKGKLERLQSFELENEEQFQVKSFLEQHLIDIPVSIYETRLEIFKDNKQ